MLQILLVKIWNRSRSTIQNQGVDYIGERFVAEIIDRIQVLIDFPDIGRKVPEFGEGKIRELIHNPFRIVYLREDKVIHIVRIWRSERVLELPDKKAK